MNKKERINLLKKLSQQSEDGTDSDAVATPETAPTTPVQQTIDIRAIPNFKDQLFALRPDIINDLNGIVNIINQNLITLSGNKISFNIVWNNPSISGSEFSNSVKNLLNLAKWIYNVIRSNAQPYSIEGLKQIGLGLIKTVREYSFPEPQAASLQNKLTTAGQLMITKLGG